MSWEEFKDTEVTQSMNLYPVAYAITFLDSEESVYDGMVYSVSEGEDGTRELNTLFTKNIHSLKSRLQWKKLQVSMTRQI